MPSNEAILQQIYDNEITEQIVYSIREELMDRVMEECHKSYLKKQTIRFVVQCAYDAMVKFLCIQFYYHPLTPDTTESIWQPDEPIEPSPKDSWAHSAVTIRPSGFKNESAHAETDQSTISKVYTESLEPCTCIKECDCMYSQEETNSITAVLKDRPTPSKVKFSAKPSKLKIGERIESHHSLKINSKTTMDSVVSSTGTTHTLASTFDTPPSAAALTSSIDVRRKRENPLQKEVKLEIPPPIQRGSHASVVKLPPIRMCTKLSSKPGEEKKKKRR